MKVPNAINGCDTTRAGPCGRCSLHGRRGLALLLALAVLVLCLTGVVTTAELATRTKLSRTLNDASIIADDLLLAVEQPIRVWLQERSAAIAVDPDAVTPEVPVLHHLWHVEDIEHELRVTAWDQCGMVPLAATRAGSPLRLTLPEQVRRILDDAALDEPHVNLQSFVDEVEQTALMRIYPRPRIEGDEPRIYGETIPQATLTTDQNVPVAMGAYVATHQSSSEAQINVNTAPMKLVTAALRDAGRSGLEQIKAARAAGEALTLGALPDVENSRSRSSHLISSSPAWAFRIDIRVDAVVRSWWCIFVRSEANSWECLERHVINH